LIELLRFIIFSYIILGGICLGIFMYELFLLTQPEAELFQELAIAGIILASIIVIYFICDFITGRTDSGGRAIALLPYR